MGPRLRGDDRHCELSTVHQPATPPRRAAFIFVFITVLLDMLALGIVIPVLPKLVVDFLAGDTARAAEIYGIFGTVWALMQFLCSPVHGSLSDRFGRRPVILISNLGLGLDYFLMALAPNLWWLFLGRVISGISAASIATSYAYIADVTPPELRSARFGSPARSASPTPSTGFWCCRNHCCRKNARASRGGGPIRSARSRCCGRSRN